MPIESIEFQLPPRSRNFWFTTQTTRIWIDTQTERQKKKQQTHTERTTQNILSRQRRTIILLSKKRGTNSMCSTLTTFVSVFFFLFIIFFSHFTVFFLSYKKAVCIYLLIISLTVRNVLTLLCVSFGFLLFSSIRDELVEILQRPNTRLDMLMHRCVFIFFFSVLFSHFVFCLSVSLYCGCSLLIWHLSVLVNSRIQIHTHT